MALLGVVIAVWSDDRTDLRSSFNRGFGDILRFRQQLCRSKVSGRLLVNAFLTERFNQSTAEVSG
jgi:hypothetical protein